MKGIEKISGSESGKMKYNKYNIETSGSSTIITYPGGTKNRVFQLVPGILFSFNHVAAKVLPALNSETPESFVTINHARRGVCEMQTDSGSYIYVKGGDLCISREIPDRQFRFPTGEYEGIEIYVFREYASEESENEILTYLNIDPAAIYDNYLDDTHGTFISHSADILEEPLENLYKMAESETPDVPLLRLYGLQILRMLTAALPSLRPAVISALTPAQLEIAERAEKILSENLDKRIPLRKIAESMGISESSLRNYFRGVFGKNVSDYLFDMRMKKARTLLKETGLPVGEISRMAGYSSQSRFNSAFRKSTGCTPLEFRKNQVSNVTGG